MRNILFRGKPVKSDDYYFFSQNWKNYCKDGFVYGSLVVSYNKCYICVSAMCNVNCCINNGITSMIEVIPETVGQHTGLPDKNGKKIFEGDIVQMERGLMLNGEYAYRDMCKVIYDRCCFLVAFADGCRRTRLYREGDTERYEIIGNIHDNPELLEVKPDAD